MRKLSKKLSVILILVLVVGLVAGTALVRKVQEIRKYAAPAAPNVTISPVTQDKAPGETFSFAVNSNTGTHSVAGVDLYLNYDSSVIEISSITKGSGIYDFSEWVSTIDNSNGKISYTATALNTAAAVSGSNVEILRVNGKVKSSASTGSFNISFDSGTILGDAGGNDISANKGSGEIKVGAGAPGGTTVFFSPYWQSKRPNDTFDFTVRVDTNLNSVAGVDLYLNYDSSVIEITSVQKGFGLAAFTEWVNTIDNTNGEILFTATAQNMQDAVSGSGIEFLMVTGIVKSGAISGQYDINFGTGTILGDTDGNDLNATLNTGSMTIEGAGTPTVTPTGKPTMSPTMSPTKTPTMSPTKTPTPKPTTSPPPTSGLPIIDNFEGYGSDAELRSRYNYDGSMTIIFRNALHVGEGNYSARLYYNITSPDYAGVWSHIPSSKDDWEAYSGINFWFEGDGQKRDLIIQFSEEDEDHWEAYLPISSTTPIEHYIPFSHFQKPSWNNGQGDGRMELDDITGFAFYVKLSSANPHEGTGSVYFDDFKLVKGGVVTPTPTPTTYTPTNTPTFGPPPPTFTPTSSPVPSTPPVGADTRLYLTTNNTTKQLDREFTIDLMIDTGKNDVVGTEVYMSFDPTMIQALNIVPGSFIPNPVERIRDINNNTGSISYVLLVPTNDNPVNGTGKLATLTFKALAEGTTRIDITSETIVGAVNTGARNALRSRQGITLTIKRPSLPGDINDMGTYCGDGVVNILDYTILFEHFWESPSTHPCADINQDGIVNTLDYVVLYENFGKSI